ncbi:MAG: AAA family ATPase [Candidatus Latescibacterota bacterium]|nr:AAA family ATPase [Candidatus Latescibacterota bacterium]
MAPAQIITVSGLPGSGTSTACDQLCRWLGWAHVDAGQIFRQLAREAGLSLAEFGQRAEVDGCIDRQLDERMVAQAQAQAPIVVEGRLTGWMAQRNALSAVKIWLAGSPEIRSRRVARRESKAAAQVLVEIRQREASEARRYEQHHKIRIDDLSVYDLVVNTEALDVQKVVAQILAYLEKS